jgi:hypothetical protein
MNETIYLPHTFHQVNKTHELEENHETLSDEILIVIFLIVLSGWLHSMIFRKFCSIRNKNGNVIEVFS